jgi:hypothetical protein
MRRRRPEAALAEYDRMLAIISTESFRGAGYDRAWAHYWRSACMMQLGRIAEAGELAAATLEDALARGDHTVSNVLTQTVCFGLMARGRIEQADRVLEAARLRLQSHEVTVQDGQWLSARMATSMYADRAVEVWNDTAQHRARYFKSWYGRTATMGGAMALVAAGLAAEAARVVSDPAQQRELRREARRLLRFAGKSPPGTVGVPSAVLLACLDGDRERAISVLRESIPALDVPLIQQLRRRRLGELLGGDEGAALIGEADAFLRAGGVIDPARYTAACMAGVVLTTDR